MFHLGKVYNFHFCFSELGFFFLGHFYRKNFNNFWLPVLKSDLLAALNKEVKSMDEDSWMFEGPRSRINLISKGG